MIKYDRLRIVQIRLAYHVPIVITTKVPNPQFAADLPGPIGLHNNKE